MTTRKARYGRLVRGWDWRTLPERLRQAEQRRIELGMTRTEYLEYCIDKELSIVADSNETPAT